MVSCPEINTLRPLHQVMVLYYRLCIGLVYRQVLARCNIDRVHMVSFRVIHNQPQESLGLAMAWLRQEIHRHLVYHQVLDPYKAYLDHTASCRGIRKPRQMFQELVHMIPVYRLPQHQHRKGPGYTVSDRGIHT